MHEHEQIRNKSTILDFKSSFLTPKFAMNPVQMCDTWRQRLGGVFQTN